MTIELLLPGRRISAPKMPSRVALAMAFGVGAGAVLGDKSRYRSHGAITTATWAAGVHGYGLDFVAANPDYVVIPAAHTQLDFTTEDFSFIARFNQDNIVGDKVLFIRGLLNTDGWIVKDYANARWGLETEQLAARQATFMNAGHILAGNWYTLGISRNGAAVTLYVNGVDATDNPVAHFNPATCARSAKIGVYDDLAGTPFDGRVEFLRIFRGIALQASEHLAWHNALA